MKMNRERSRRKWDRKGNRVVKWWGEDSRYKGRGGGKKKRKVEEHRKEKAQQFPFGVKYSDSEM